MSQFYDLASLVVIPSGYKASTIYAQKPLTTDGQLSFTRASTATRVNASGLIEAVASNVPRLDYTNSTCPRLLLEPQRTNVVANSEVTSGYSTFGAAFTQNTATSPQGSVNADTMAGNGASTQIFAATPITFASAGEVTISVFAKANTASFIDINLDNFTGASNTIGIFNLATGTTASSGASIENYGNGWYRCILTATIDAGDLSGSMAIDIRPSVASQFWPSAGDANGKSVFVWGFMAELGAYATSYIPTLGATVTRVADAASKTGISSLIGQTEGTMFIDADYIASTGGNYNTLILLTPSAGVGAGYVVIDRYPDNTVVCEYNQGGSQAKITSVETYGSQRLKIAFAYKANDFVAYVNGVQIGTDNSGTTGLTLTDLLITYDPNSPFGGRVSQALLFKTRLTNAQLAELTTL